MLPSGGKTIIVLLLARLKEGKSVTADDGPMFIIYVVTFSNCFAFLSQ